jgi:hypothetical protein
METKLQDKIKESRAQVTLIYSYKFIVKYSFPLIFLFKISIRKTR